MLVYVHGAKCLGIDAVPVTVEVNITLGVGIHLVGLADAAVKESLLRTVTALQAKGFHVPGMKIVINLAPADLHKQGSGYDLPIALGVIAASAQRALPELEHYLIMGELGLDGSIRPVSGTLPMVELARRLGFRGCILPEESALEAVDYGDVEIYGVRTLEDVLRRVRWRLPATRCAPIWILPISSARKGPSAGWKSPARGSTMSCWWARPEAGKAR